MPAYYHDKSASLPWSNPSTIAASIVLDQALNVSYTNLDQVSGKVVVRCGKSLEVDSIDVKVEGESRTRLLAPDGPGGERGKPQVEYHRILYKVQTVFPPPDVAETRVAGGSARGGYTLGPGNHEYLFKVKLPFNNACAGDRSQMGTMSISGSGFEVAKPPVGHVKKTLPPTLSGFPGEAEIRYFVKCTVRRSSFWKENPRSFAPFNFFPIEPPRPAPSGNEVYARQKQSFNTISNVEVSKAKLKSLFGKSKDGPASPVAGDAPVVTIDARLPEPAILTCNEDIPLRLILKKLNSSTGMIYVDSLQVSLIGNTKIRAHDVYRTEGNTWIIMSRSNMGMFIGAASDAAGTESTIPDHFWRGHRLPNTVAPSFQACNISRSYQLDVRIGLSYSGGAGNSAKPQTVVLPLRLDCTVFSGIAPPPQLLEAMAHARSNGPKPAPVKTNTALDEKLKAERRRESVAPDTPIDGPSSHEFPARQGMAMPAQAPIYDDAPPSYEDAVGGALPPVEVRRPDYAPPPAGEDQVLRSDEKKRRDS